MAARLEEALLREIIDAAESLTFSALDLEGIKTTDHDKALILSGITQGADMALSVLARRGLINGLGELNFTDLVVETDDDE